MGNRIHGSARYRVAVVSVLITAVSCAFADPPAPASFSEIGHEFPGFDNPTAAHIAVGDFDGDGKQDFAFVGSTGMNSTQALSVVGKKSDGTIGFKQQSLLPDPHAARVLTLPQTTGQPHVLTVDSDGQVREYAGWPLAEVHSFMSLSTVAGAVVGDLYGDGTQRLALCTDSKIAVYDVAAGSLKWSIPFQGCTDLIAYQLDGVGAMELIIAGAKPGVVLDASNGSTRWSYPDSFGTTVAAGNLGTHGETEFVGSGNQITVFSANPYSPLWDYSSGYYFGASGLAVTDVTGDGRADILFKSSYGGIQVLDSVTQTATPLSPNGGPCHRPSPSPTSTVTARTD